MSDSQCRLCGPREDLGGLGCVVYLARAIRTANCCQPVLAGCWLAFTSFGVDFSLWYGWYLFCSLASGLCAPVWFWGELGRLFVLEFVGRLSSLVLCFLSLSEYVVCRSSTSSSAVSFLRSFHL